MNFSQIKTMINNEIAELTTYGRREITIQKTPVTILSWSNGAKKWIVYAKWTTEQLDIGDSIELDANQLLVYFSNEKVREVAEDLDELPLYKNSFEYGQRLKEGMTQ